jgi:hypothetical protein
VFLEREVAVAVSADNRWVGILERLRQLDDRVSRWLSTSRPTAGETARVPPMPPPGWYPSPQARGEFRWWNGEAWQHSVGGPSAASQSEAATRTPRLDRLIVAVSVLMIVFAVIIVIADRVPGEPILPTNVFVVPFLAVFPCFGWAVIGSYFVPGRRRSWRVWDPDPLTAPRRSQLALVIVGVVVAVAVVACLLTTHGSLRGQPEIHHGKYYLDDHGGLIPVTHAQYDQAVKRGQQLFASSALLFHLFAVVIITVPLDRGSRRSRRPGT